MTTHLFSGSLHYFNGNGVDFIMHLHSSFLAAANLYQKHPEVCTSKIQSQKVTIFYKRENTEIQKSHESCSIQKNFIALFVNSDGFEFSAHLLSIYICWMVKTLLDALFLTELHIKTLHLKSPSGKQNNVMCLY